MRTILRILHQKLQNGKFCSGQLFSLPLHRQRKGNHIHHQISNGKEFDFIMLYCLTQLNNNTGQKFLCIKRFSHVIGGTAQQKIYFVLHIHLCSENDNGNVLNVGKNFLARQL